MRIFKYEIIFRKAELTEKEVIKYAQSIVRHYSGSSKIQFIKDIREHFKKKYPVAFGEPYSEWISLKYIADLVKRLLNIE